MNSRKSLVKARAVADALKVDLTDSVTVAQARLLESQLKDKAVSQIA